MLDGWMKKMMEGIMGLRKAPLSKKHDIDERDVKVLLKCFTLFYFFHFMENTFFFFCFVYVVIFLNFSSI